MVALAGTVGDAWLRVFVETDGPIPGIADRVREALPNALDVQLVYDRTADDEAERGPPGSARSVRATSSRPTSG